MGGLVKLPIVALLYVLVQCGLSQAQQYGIGLSGLCQLYKRDPVCSPSTIDRVESEVDNLAENEEVMMKAFLEVVENPAITDIQICKTFPGGRMEPLQSGCHLMEAGCAGLQQSFHTINFCPGSVNNYPTVGIPPFGGPPFGGPTMNATVNFQNAGWNGWGRIGLMSGSTRTVYHKWLLLAVVAMVMVAFAT